MHLFWQVGARKVEGGAARDGIQVRREQVGQEYVFLPRIIIPRKSLSGSNRFPFVQPGARYQANKVAKKASDLALNQSARWCSS